jgi:hypothetical protein
MYVLCLGADVVSGVPVVVVPAVVAVVVVI